MIKIFTISIFITISLFARVNPFEADESMINKKSDETMIKKPIPITEPLNSKDDGKRSVKVEMAGNASDNKKMTNVLPKVIIKEKIVKMKLTKEEIAAQCAIDAKENNTTKSTPPVMTKLKTKMIKSKSSEFVAATYKILPFVKVDVNLNDLKVSSRDKYNIVTYHGLKDTNKIAFDFLADVWFYTRFKKLDAPNFKSYLVGNHKKHGFFRVTITLEHNIKDYEVTIKNNIASIKYKK